jgi:polyisoprenyl-phosphate glycosyltransferase
MSLLSIIIPAYNEEGNILLSHDKITSFMDKIKQPYELIFINDGSSDKTLELIKDCRSANKNTRFISFSRNFGKEAATTAGLSVCKGDVAIIYDADGQFPVDVIGTLLSKWSAGYQVVVGIRIANKNEGFVKRYGSRLYYWMLDIISGSKSIPGATDFRAIDRKVIDEFKRFTEHGRMTRGLIDWIGFNRAYVEFSALERESGEASYSFRKLTQLALNSFVSHSTLPLRLSGQIGGFIMASSMLSLVLIVLGKYLLHDPLGLAITGTAILALGVSFMVGLVLACQGLLALYIENIYTETQNRPLYIISEES